MKYLKFRSKSKAVNQLSIKCLGISFYGGSMQVFLQYQVTGFAPQSMLLNKLPKNSLELANLLQNDFKMGEILISEEVVLQLKEIQAEADKANVEDDVILVDEDEDVSEDEIEEMEAEIKMEEQIKKETKKTSKAQSKK